MPPCKFFAAGSCRFGTSCRNSHIFAPPEYTVPAAQDICSPHPKQDFQRPAIETAVSSTKVCWFFSQGHCRYGTSCKNPHDIPTPGGGLQQKNQSISAKTTLDPEVLQLAEQVGELQVSGAGTSPLFQANQVRGPEQSGNGTTCTFFAKGSCRYGDSCRYAHQVVSPGRTMIEEVHQYLQEVSLFSKCYLP